MALPSKHTFNGKLPYIWVQFPSYIKQMADIEGLIFDLLYGRSHYIILIQGHLDLPDTEGELRRRVLYPKCNHCTLTEELKRQLPSNRVAISMLQQFGWGRPAFISCSLYSQSSCCCYISHWPLTIKLRQQMGCDLKTILVEGKVTMHGAMRPFLSDLLPGWCDWCLPSISFALWWWSSRGLVLCKGPSYYCPYWIVLVKTIHHIVQHCLILRGPLLPILYTL